jgi:glyoxylase-like metal-dependent hydrolase (beta-lactamase superfamily II)
MIRIELPLAPLRGPTHINVYLLEGQPLTLVDTGPCTEAAWGALGAGLAAHGHRVADLEQVVITHGHVDHYGLAARIVAARSQPRSPALSEVEGDGGVAPDGTALRCVPDYEQVEVLAHPDAAPWVAGEVAFHERDARYYSETLCRAGIPAGLLARWQARIRDLGPLAEPVQVTRMVVEGEYVTQGAAVWEVIHLPGHAPGLIGLYRRDTAELILSDHLLPDKPSAPGLHASAAEGVERHRYMVDYMASLHRLKEISARIAWPSHGEPFCDVPGLVDRRLAEHRRQADELASLLADGEKTPYQLWQALFPRLLPLDPPGGTVQVISHLDLLEAEGRVQAHEREGRVYYRLC